MDQTTATSELDSRQTGDWAARAAALTPMIEAAADRNERERRIAPEVIAALSDAGILHMLLPASLGGGAADIVSFNRVIQTVAAADASTAWVLAQTLASSHAAGFLAPQVAREVFGAKNAVVAWGPSSGVAKAVVTDGGYTVTGKWRFASGSANATWMGGHSSVIEANGKPRLDANGRPLMRTMLFRPASATIHDTWHVIGLRGTASNEYEAHDLFVPEPYSTWRDYKPDRRESGPLYNIPLLTLYGIGFSGVGLGIARACLAAFMTLAGTKKTGAGYGSQSVLRDNAVIQSKVAQAAGQLDSAHALLTRRLEEIWEASCTRGKFTLDERARLRIAIVGAMDRARDVVDFAYHASGTTAIFQGSPFERRFRDMHTLLAQGQAHLSNFEAAGLALMGVEPTQRL
jgi:alkylation response protein AidB-like acyl-CoA dehydrogenase